MLELFEWLKITVVFLLMISALVAAHEYGHYLFARLFKMGVEEFAIGMGKPIFVWRRKVSEIPLTEAEGRELVKDAYDAESGVALVVPRSVRQETLYTVRPFPIGGFVRIKAMMPEEDGSEVRVPGGFYSKALWKRFLVLLAGPTFSVLAGMILLFAMVAIWGTEHSTTTVDQVVDPGPASKAGLQHGDKIVAIDGQRVDDYYGLISKIRDRAGQLLRITYQRDGKIYQTSATPTLEDSPSVVIQPDGLPSGETKRQAKLFMFAEHYTVRAPVSLALATAVAGPIDVVEGLLEIVRGKAKVKDSVGGPVAIFGATKDAADDGLRHVFYLAAMLSISLGFFNLFPIPPLDGGQMLVTVLEMLRRGRRLSLQVQGALAGLGFAVLAMMVASVFYLDINRALHKTPPPPMSKK